VTYFHGGIEPRTGLTVLECRGPGPCRFCPWVSEFGPTDERIHHVHLIDLSGPRPEASRPYRGVTYV
jgi:hypothetical protein